MNPFKKNKTIYLIRHGEIIYPLDEKNTKLIYGSDVSLDPLGRLQIQELAKKLQEEHAVPDVFAVSPFKRTQESAEILQDILGVPFYSVSNLRDIDPNSWEGYPLNELDQFEGDVYSHPRSANQETLEHLVKRAKKALEAIVSDNPGKRIGIISHGDLLSAIVWILKHQETPSSYKEMKNNFYLNKGQAYECVVDEGLRMRGNGRFINVSELNEGIEGFRHLPAKKS